MLRVENRWPHYYDSCKIEWNIGKRCNLDCTYCPAEIHDNHSQHRPIEELESVADTISSIPNVRVSLTGGEPCVHPKFESLIWYLKARVKWISVTTNATRNGRWYANLPVDYIVFSLHYEDVSWKTRLLSILDFDNFKYQQQYHVNIMAHHEHMDKVKETVRAFQAHNVPYAIRRIRWTEKHDWFDDLKYQPADLEWIIGNEATAAPNTLIDNKELAHTNDLIKEHKNKFKGWTCRAGIESLMINWDGEVHRATCRVGGSLGNIYRGNFQIPSDPVVCTREWCTCAADVNITKWKQ